MIDHTGDYATDPGTEVLDLPDELALNAHEARSWLDVPAHVITPDLARLTGHAPDYEWCTWLADVLRAAGLHVIEQPGWKTRGRPRSAVHAPRTALAPRRQQDRTDAQHGPVHRPRRPARRRDPRAALPDVGMRRLRRRPPGRHLARPGRRSRQPRRRR